MIAVLVPDDADDECGFRLRRLRDAFGDRAYLALTLRRRPNDQMRLWELSQLAQRFGVPTVVTNDVLFHEPGRRMLQDVVTAMLNRAVISAPQPFRCPIRFPGGNTTSSSACRTGSRLVRSRAGRWSSWPMEAGHFRI